MEESHGGKFDLRRPHEFNKIISWGRRIYFYHFLIFLWHFGELLLVHCTMSVHSPYLWTNFEGVGFLSKLVYGEEIQKYNGRLMKDFYFQVEFPYSWILIYLPIFSFLLLHSPTLSFDGALVGVILASCWWWFMPNIWFMMYGFVISSAYYM